MKKVTGATIGMKRNSAVEFLSGVMLVSRHPWRLASFYKDIVGIPLKEEEHDGGAAHYGCELGDIHFAIHPSGTYPDNIWGTGSVRLAFTVFDLASLVERLAGNGHKLLYAPRATDFGLITAVCDPDGNYIEFTQLSESWYSHLEERKKQGYDVVSKWKQHQKERTAAG